METLYPSQIDTYVQPNATDSVQTVSHSAQHRRLNDAIYKLQLKVGINNSQDVSSIENRLTTLKNFVDARAVDLGQLEDSLDEYVTLIQYENDKGVAIATLGVDGKLDPDQIPSSIATDAQSRADAALSAAGLYTDQKNCQSCRFSTWSIKYS